METATTPPAEMTAADALGLMTQVCDKWVGTKADHLNLAKALGVLGELVEGDTAAADTKPSVSDDDLGIQNDNPPAEQ